MKTSGVSCETKFGLLVFLGHPIVDVVVDFDLGVEESISDTVVTLTWQVLDNGFWRIIWLLLRLLINSSFLGWYFG